MRAVRTYDSLVFRLVAFAVLILVGSSAGRWWAANSSLRGSIEELAYAQQFALATYVAADIEGKLQLRRRQLEALARGLVGRIDRPRNELEDWLVERADLLTPFTLGLTLVPTDGRGTLADLPLGGGHDRLDYRERDWFQAVVRSHQFAVGRAGLGALTRVPSIALAVPVTDAQGRLRAVLAGITALEGPEFLDLIQRNTIGRHGGFLLVSPRDLQIVAASDPDLRLKPTPRAGVDLLHDRAMGGYRGTGITINAAGGEDLAAIASVPSASWFVVARIPTREAFAPVLTVARYNLWSSAVIGSGVVIFLLLFLRSALRPLSNAAAEMRRMADGETPLARLPVRRPDEVGQMVEGFNHLVDKLRASEDRLAALAHQDALTGLPNRRAFFDIGSGIVDQARLRGRQLALLFIDIDGFKPVNDALGHLRGDELLRQFAARLREVVREGDLVARFGGDEFVVLMGGPLGQEVLRARVSALITRLSEDYVMDGEVAQVGASIGVAGFPEHADDLDRLVALADAAMYAAKRSGRNQWRRHLAQTAG